MPKDRISRSRRDRVFERAKGCCEYCFSQQKFSMDTFSVDHILPRSKGGSDNLDNLALSCQGCNACKYNRIATLDPQTNQMVPLYNPRTDAWIQHFTWSEDRTDILGLTSTGCATIKALQLNRPGNQNLRRVLHPLGKHPPS